MVSNPRPRPSSTNRRPKLTVGEAALLAGLLKSPTHYSPVSEQDRAGRRATIVLDKMVETGAITPAQRDEALADPVKVSPALATQHAQYFVDWVDGQVRKLVGQPETDLVVETTLDLPIDTAAENAARSVVDRYAKAGVQQAAVVALDGNGRVRALIGGVSYAQSQFDRAVDARPPGRLVVEAVRLSDGDGGGTHTRQPGRRRAGDHRRLEPPQLLKGSSWDRSPCRSRCSARSTRSPPGWPTSLGRDNVADTARRLGVASPINTDPAMALGTTQVSPLEMAQAYAPFANGGFAAPAYAIERIRTADGKVLYEHERPPRTSVVPEPALGEMTQMLRSVLVSPGNGRPRPDRGL